MAKTTTLFHSFSVGVHDSTALARVDLERMRLAAEVQTNFLCKATGPGFMRPGTEYLTSTDGNKEAYLKEFVFGVSDAAMLEFTASTLRVMVDDVIITRPAVTSSVTNGDFSSSTGWDTTGFGAGVSTISGGKLTMNATHVDAVSECSRSVTTLTPNVEHALRIIVDRGPVLFKCGSSAGAEDYIPESELPTGEHSLAFTPTGTYYVQFSSKATVIRIVDSIQVEAAGIMELPTPWALVDLPKLRIAQSADVCYVACEGYQQRRLERRAARSWSVCLYTVDDGPFSLNPSPTPRLKPSVLNGNGSLVASTNYFTAAHVGSLFRLDHSGQSISQTLTAEDTFTDAIRVTGITANSQSDRDFTITISGTWSGTLTIQRSYDDPESGFVDVGTYTANTAEVYGDNADNAIYYYRIGFKVGAYTSGTAQISIVYDGGGGYGIGRVTSYSNAKSVGIEVLRPFKGTVYTRDWQPGEWSDYKFWPSAVVLSDGRLWWSGEDRIWGSVSDAFLSFDEETEGDSGPISRSIATGGVNDTKWMLSLQRFLIATEGAISVAKSSSLDEPLTPTNFGIKDCSTVGAAAVDPIKVDTRGIFVERAGTALYELSFDSGSAGYMASQISKLTTEIFESGVKAIAVQRRPDTRIWLVLEDGSCVCMVYEPEDEVLAFIPIQTDGEFESVAVLPALIQDRVYFSVKRVVNGSTVRYLEKMAMDTEVKPGTLCKVMDAFKVFTSGAPTVTVTGLSHLVGETVVAWADGAPVEISSGVRQEFTVSGDGTITLTTAVSNVVVGLAYRARWKSARLAYGSGGTAMLQKKTVDQLGMILTDFVRAGIKYGRKFDDPLSTFFSLPQSVQGATPAPIVLSDIHDEEAFVFPGTWDIDGRCAFEVNSPYTMTALGLVLTITSN